MLVLRSRATPLIASSLLFISFFFSTIHLGEGLKCYSCLSTLNKDCVNNVKDVPSVECGVVPTEKPTEPTPTEKPTEPTPTEKPTEPTPTEKPKEPTTTEKPTNPGSLFDMLKPEAYADTNEFVCVYVSGSVNTTNVFYSMIHRGCAPKIFNCTNSGESHGIKIDDCWTCDTDNCNPANGIQIGVISLFLPLIASLLVSR